MSVNGMVPGATAATQDTEMDPTVSQSHEESPNLVSNLLSTANGPLESSQTSANDESCATINKEAVKAVNRKRQRGRRDEARQKKDQKRIHVSKKTSKRPVVEAKIVCLKSYYRRSQSLAAATTSPLDIEEPLPPHAWVRRITPYMYQFTSHAKARWIGRTLLDVYCTEFGRYPSSYYKAAITTGMIRVSGNIQTPDYCIQSQDVLLHTVHRHEPLVRVSVPKTQGPTESFNAHSTQKDMVVTCVTETKDVLVVDKPSLLPIHPCGGYHENSLVNILSSSSTNQSYYPIHRLDRLTSGLVILGKTSKVAKEWAQAMRTRTCQKLYLARVKGKFPNGIVETKRPAIQKDAATTTILPRLDNNGAPLPRHGEWRLERDKDTGKGKPWVKQPRGTKRKKSIVEERSRNAYGYWITKGDLDLDDDDKSPALIVDGSIEEVFSPVWNTPSLDDSTVFNWQEVRKSHHWLHVACPTRVEQATIGVCVCGTFDDLDEETYLRTVKPAETAFAAVKYDQTTDTTIVLCRPKTGYVKMSNTLSCDIP